MKKSFSMAKFILLTTLILIGLNANLLNFQDPFLGLFFGFYYLLFIGYLLGLILLPNEKGSWQTFIGSLTLMALIIIIGSLVYYFYKINNQAIALILTSLPVIFLLILGFKKGELEQKSEKESEKLFIKKPKTRFKIILLCLSFLFLEAVNFFLLTKSATGAAIRSPWWVIPKEFFLIYFIATLILLIITFYNRRPGISLMLVIIHFILSGSVALIIYKLGYGFDPFIHQATEKIIFSQGFILPKPFYYIGQYSLVVILAKIFSLPVEIIDKLLVPILFSITIPVIIYFAFKKITTKNVINATLPLTVLLLPFASFIVTTPQSLANVFTLLSIFFSLIYVLSEREKKWLIIIFIYTFAILIIHPLAGIPALIFFFLLVLLPNNKKRSSWKNIIKYVLFPMVTVTSLVAIPLIFAFNSFFSKNELIVKIDNLLNPQKIAETFYFFNPYFKNHFNLIYDLVYWYNRNVFLIMAIIACLAIVILALKKHFKNFYIYAIIFIILMINYLLLQTMMDFSFLIEYEKINYPMRILEIAFYFLLPFIFYAFFQLFRKILNGTLMLKLATVLLLSFFITGSLYASYPRNDDYQLDRGYNITQYDINAVRYINNFATSDYIVLANQMTSVAAIKEFGFLKYYQAKDKPEKQYFYYPIPTGDPLYQYYLDMVYQKPTKDLALEAGNLVGVDVVYLILDDYWWKFDQLVEEAKQEADSWQAIDQGKAYVFKYVRQ